MSVHSAMLTGVTGLSAYSTALSVTSSNISNSNTTGFKKSSTAFSTLLSGASTTGSTMGLAVQAEQNVTSQGELTGTTSVTDLAISGQGFFITSLQQDASEVQYTRSGGFTTDNDYQLVNSTGLYLLGYGITTNSDGTTTTAAQLSTITVNKTKGTFEPSTLVKMSGNLESDTAINTTISSTTPSPDYTKTVDFYDSQGGTQTLAVSYYKTDTNTWTYTVNYAGDSTYVSNTLLHTGTLVFDSNGTLTSVDGSTTSALGTFTIPWTADSGLDTAGQSMSLNFGAIGKTTGLTQYTTASAVSAKADGAAYGMVSSYAIGTDGILSAVYTNGLTRNLYKVPLAIFADANSLTASSGTAYKSSDASGDAIIVTAGTGGSGEIKSQNLEQSTVDIATELTDLINTQRAYSACAKIVSSATSMLDVLTQIGS